MTAPPATPESRKRGQLRSAVARRKGPRPALPGDLPVSGPPTTLDEANKLLAWAAYAVATGKIDLQTGRTCAQLCRALTAGLRANDAAKVAELERIVRQLQEQDAAKRAAERG